MTKFSHYILILPAFFLAGCSSLLEKEVDDYPLPFEEELVVTAFLMPQDSLIEVDVRTTYPVDADIQDLQQQGSTSIENASVIISDGEENMEVPYAFLKRKYILHQSDFPIEAAKTYFLDVTTPDGLSAHASCQIPAISVNKDSIRGNLDVIDEGGAKEYYFKVSFPKAQDSIAYYTILKQEYRISNNTTFITGQEQIQIIKSSDIIGDYISSESFAVAPSFANGNRKTDVLVCQTDSSYYDYHQDLNDYFINSQNPFTEAFNIYTNIENGRGVFAGLNCVVIRL